jgi:hypothetical protein
VPPRPPDGDRPAASACRATSTVRAASAPRRSSSAAAAA